MPSQVWGRDPQEAYREPYEYAVQDQFVRCVDLDDYGRMHAGIRKEGMVQFFRAAQDLRPFGLGSFDSFDGGVTLDGAENFGSPLRVTQEPIQRFDDAARDVIERFLLAADTDAVSRHKNVLRCGTHLPGIERE